MQLTCTPEDLVRFLYREGTAATALRVAGEIKRDQTLMADYKELAEAFRMLPKVTFRPSEQSIRNILEYSRQTAPTAG